MLVIKLFGEDFNRIMRGCGASLSKDNSRKILQQIEISHDGNGYGYATSLDGFVMNQIGFPCSGDEGKFLMPMFKPVSRKAEVTITADGFAVSVDDGETTITKRMIQDKDLDRRGIVEKRLSLETAYTISVDQSLLLKALKACEGTTHRIDLEFAGELDAIIVRGYKSCSMVLPLRVDRERSADRMALFYK